MKNDDNAPGGRLPMIQGRAMRAAVGALEPETHGGESAKDLRLLRDSFIERVPEHERVSSLKLAWQELWGKMTTYLSREDLTLMGEALVMAAEAHGTQLRSSGDPYVVHPVQVASVLADMGLDRDTLVAAMLHDVLEDTEVPAAEVASRFGAEVITLVDGVTKLGKLPFRSIEEYQAENLRKMFLVMAKDIRVVLIKLADRLHNMRTLQALRQDKQLRIARETMDIYAPLAHRLGIYQVKRELEDLGYRILDPDSYYDIRRRVRKKMPGRESLVKKAIDVLQNELKSAGIDVYITGRAKHYYSIAEKMRRKNLAFDQLYDLLAVRIVVSSVVECYTALGIVHTLWKPLPGQFDDYIANPKSNMYRSLHTTVVGPSGEPLEVQIRTWEMQWQAEYGIAAHWRYKGKRGGKTSDLDDNLTWIRQALEEQGDGGEPREFLTHLKEDVLTSDVFVFTPKGDVISLPHGSTPIDFAYTVHTEVGHKCVGAMVNGRIVSIDYALQNGDIVRVLTSPQGKPSRDWLKIARSNRARAKIRVYFRQQERAEREDYLAKGNEMLDRELRRRMGETDLPPASEVLALLNRVARDMGYTGAEELVVDLGMGHHSSAGVIQKVVAFLHPAEEAGPPPDLPAAPSPKREVDSEVVVEGAEGVLVSLANCCRPVPGDSIVGFATKTRGITVHRQDCLSIREMPHERRIEVAWGRRVASHYVCRVKLEATDRPGLFADVSQAIQNSDAAIVGIKANVRGASRAVMIAEIRIRDLEHLYRVMGRMGAVGGVQEVLRG